MWLLATTFVYINNADDCKFMPGALVLTLAMLLRLVNYRFIIIIISSSVDKVTTLVHRLAY